MNEKITPMELAKATTLLMKHITKLGIKEIEFKGDEAGYQKICFEDRNNISNPPISLHDVNEDIEVIKKILTPGYRKPLVYDLQKLGAIFTQLGAVLNKPVE